MSLYLLAHSLLAVSVLMMYLWFQWRTIMARNLNTKSLPWNLLLPAISGIWAAGNFVICTGHFYHGHYYYAILHFLFMMVHLVYIWSGEAQV